MSDPNARYVPADRPHFYRLDLDSRVNRGRGGQPFKGTRLENVHPPQQAQCAPYGGACLGDGCVEWFPTPSPAGCQEASCALDRDRKDMQLAEVQRRIRQNITLGNTCNRLGWMRSGIVAYQRAWAYAAEHARMTEKQGTRIA